MKKFTFISLILLLFLSAPTAGLAQTANSSALSVRGVVTDETGAPMPGVAVVAPQGGTVTNGLGEYTITVAAYGDLVFSFLGYQTRTIPVNGRTSIDISMEGDSQILDALIVIGYGTTTRRRSTGAVDQVKASQISDRSVANVSQALQGTSPSLVIQNRSFDPNNQQTNINIRGIGTMNNNNPLIVVDGIVTEGTGALNQINPQDIGSVSILKDAGTSAIYGSRAANGVILITTKQGNRNQAPTVQFNAMLGVQSPKRLFEPVEGYQNATLLNLALANSGMALEFTQAQIRDLYEGGNGSVFFDEIVRPALQQNYNASVSGGSKNTTYLVSGGYFDQRSNYVGPNYGLRRYSFRTNVTTEHGRFKVAANMAYTRINGTASSEDESMLISDARRVPTYYYNRQVDPATGKYLINSALRQYNSLGRLEKGGIDKSDNDWISANAAVDFRIIEGLKLRGVMGADLNNDHRYTRTHQVEFYNQDDMDAAPMIDKADTKSEDWSKKNWMVNMQIMADFDRYFGRHHVIALIGGSNESYQNQEHQISIKNPDTDLGIKGDGSTADITGDAPGASYVTPERTTRRSITSLFGRVGYDYADRYFIEGSFRYDGTSKFDRNHRWGFFPSVSASWRLSEEDFLDWWKYNMGEMKIRATYGTLGNQNVDDYQYFNTWDLYQNTYGFNNTPVAGAGFKIGSEDLKWEVTRTFNVGLDVSFFNNSLNVTFDYFVRNTSDILTGPRIPDMYGTTPKDTNNGRMRTQGWEFTVNYFLRTGKVNHTFNANLGDSWNEVREYSVYEERSHQEELWHMTRIGLPFKSYYGYRTDGIFQTQAEADASAQFSGRRFQAGDPRFIDRNGDGVLDDNDQFYLGHGFPRYSFGFSYSLEWKGIDFNIFLQGVLKRELNIRGEMVEPFHETYGHTMYKHQLDFWTPTNTNAALPRLAKDNFVYGKEYGSDLYVFNGAYMRVKNIQIGYTLPQKWSQKAGMSKLRVYVNAQNPFTFAATNFVDPEASEFDGNMSGGSNYNRSYPTIRYWGGGLDITF